MQRREKEEKEKKKKETLALHSGCIHLSLLWAHIPHTLRSHSSAAVEPSCLAHWETRRWRSLFCMNHMTKLYYASFKGAAKWGLLLCLHNKRVQKEVPALLNPLSNCWVTEEVAAETKNKLQNKHNGWRALLYTWPVPSVAVKASSFNKMVTLDITKSFQDIELKSLIIYVKLQIHTTARKYTKKLFQFQGYYRCSLLM